MNDGSVERTCSQPHCHKSAWNWANPVTRFTISLCTRKPTPCSCISSFPLKYTLWTPSVWDFSRMFRLISHNPRMFVVLVLIHYMQTLAAVLRVPSFHVAMVMSSLPRSLAPVAYVAFPPRCSTGNAVVVSIFNICCRNCCPSFVIWSPRLKKRELASCFVVCAFYVWSCVSSFPLGTGCWRRTVPVSLVFLDISNAMAVMLSD